VNPDRRISSAYSASLERILQEKDLEGRDFLSLLRPLLPPNHLITAEDFLDLQFNPRARASQLEKYNPLEELPITLTDEEGNTLQRILSFQMRRILQGSEIRSILVTVSDVTDEVQDQRKAAQEEKTRERQFALMWEIIQNEPEAIAQFLRFSEKQLNDINQFLREDSYLSADRTTRIEEHREKAEHIFRCIHNIKSLASSIHLTSVIQQCRKVETELLQLKQYPTVNGEQFFGAVVDIAELRNQVEEVEMLSGRMSEVPRMRASEPLFDADTDGQRVARQLNQTVTSVADRQGKKVLLDTSAAHFDHLPSALLEQLFPVFVQLVRNSIKHGIESPEERFKLGKLSTGRITIQTGLPNPSEAAYSIWFRDDGAGLPMDDIKTKIVEQQLLTPEEAEALTDEELSLYIMSHGLTTTAEPDQDGGQGVGMDIVHQIVTESLRGRVWIRSQRGRNCEFVIQVPEERVGTPINVS
ncbi:MAG: ATP-binding protein, partial [Verrucomicrobiota bacterium]